MTAEVPRPLSWLTPDEDAWRAEVARFAEKAVAPRAAAMDAEARFPDELLTELAAAGLLGVQVPESYGGRGGGLFHVVLAIEELAKADPATAVLVDVQNALVTQALLSHGTGDQKRGHLPVLAGGTVGAFALSEEHSGSDALALATTATPDGQGYVLDGTKRWITNAAEAGLFLLLARVPDRGVTAFLVDRSAEGLTVGERTPKMGIRATSTCEVHLEAVRVSARSVLGRPGQGDVVAVSTLDIGKLGIAAQLVGLADGALSAAVAYAQEREQFGRPIGAYQGVRFPLAEAGAALDAARVQLYNATRLAQHGAEHAELTRATSTAKYLASQCAERTASLAVEVLGGNGFAVHGGVEKLYRDAKVGTIYEGTSNMQFRTLSALLLRGVAEHSGDAAATDQDLRGGAARTEAAP
ncbi:acyl-CoA dehydrogenase family protein [Streptomyces sp. TR06-5]|uniref:acyl-CoA dehydrogenase family protein n=1 Tax=unclassified Streptomyces TaxID=2593676 RepID=UPI00399F547F